LLYRGRAAARQKRKGSGQENGGTVSHNGLIINGVRQRKTQQAAESGPGKGYFLCLLKLS